MKYLHRSEMFAWQDGKVVKTSSHTYNAGKNAAKRERKIVTAAIREAMTKQPQKTLLHGWSWPSTAEYGTFGDDK